MRPHGRARVSARYPEALAVCDRCQFMWNLSDLQWQWDWQQGPRLKNLYKLVCPDCLDIPQESGRTIVLPPDPIPVANARPDNYVTADNPQSALGYSPATSQSPVPSQTISQNIGTLTQGWGVNGAFDGFGTSSNALAQPFFPPASPAFGTSTAPAAKRYPNSAYLPTALSSFGNWVGKNWNQDVSGFSLLNPSTVAIQTAVVSSVTFYSPRDVPFLFSQTQYPLGSATAYTFDGSNDGQNWTSLASGTTNGVAGDVISLTPASAAPFQYHRIAIAGSSTSSVAIAQVKFTLSNAAQNDI